MRITIDLIASAPQTINPTLDRMISIRGCKISMIENLGATLDHFDCIDLSDNEILKLENIPPLQRLKTLVVCNNRISRIAADAVQFTPNLESVVLTNNKIESLNDLDPLFVAKNLTRLSLVDNPVTSLSHYRLYVIFHLPKLRFLDFKRIGSIERNKANSIFGDNKIDEFKAKLGARAPRSEDASVADGNQKKSMNSTLEYYGEDAERIKLAISQATSLEEITRLERLLKSQMPIEGIIGGAAQANFEEMDEGKVEDADDEDMEE